MSTADLDTVGGTDGVAQFDAAEVETLVSGTWLGPLSDPSGVLLDQMTAWLNTEAPARVTWFASSDANIESSCQPYVEQDAFLTIVAPTVGLDLTVSLVLTSVGDQLQAFSGVAEFDSASLGLLSSLATDRTEISLVLDAVEPMLSGDLYTVVQGPTQLLASFSSWPDTPL